MSEAATQFRKSIDEYIFDALRGRLPIKHVSELPAYAHRFTMVPGERNQPDRYFLDGLPLLDIHKPKMDVNFETDNEKWTAKLSYRIQAY